MPPAANRRCKAPKTQSFSNAPNPSIFPLPFSGALEGKRPRKFVKVMALIVQKYGGTSVGNTDRIKNVAARVAKYHAQGDKIVVVVSAMSGVTDNLIKLAKEIMPLPNEREMDVLLATGEQTTIALAAIALHSIGIPAVSLTGAQAGIITDGVHTKAKIQNISPKVVHDFLNQGNVVIVAGFQGHTSEGQITTLGRGGSDLTAIALAAALKANLCQIYTDVDGVYTADPRIVTNAKKLEEVSYDEMLELASLGAKVMQSRSVEFAKKFGVIFEVRSSLNDNPGTIVKEETKSMEGVVVRGVSLDKNQAKITLVAVPDKPGVAARIFKALGDATVNVDMIVQNISHGTGTPATDLSFTLDKPDLLKAQKVIESLKKEIAFGNVITSEKIGKLSIVGVGMKSHSGVAGKMFETLANEGVNIEMISTSEIKISVVIDLAKGEQAMKAIHAAFIG
jgi:aspartate kinase